MFPRPPAPPAATTALSPSATRSATMQLLSWVADAVTAAWPQTTSGASADTAAALLDVAACSVVAAPPPALSAKTGCIPKGPGANDGAGAATAVWLPFADASLPSAAVVWLPASASRRYTTVPSGTSTTRVSPTAPLRRCEPPRPPCPAASRRRTCAKLLTVGEARSTTLPPGPPLPPSAG
jgi:hypothetical protein